MVADRNGPSKQMDEHGKAKDSAEIVGFRQMKRENSLKKIASFYTTDEGEAKTSDHEGEDAEGLAPSGWLKRWRSRARPPHPELHGDLMEVARKRGWRTTLDGTHERLNTLNLVHLAGERKRPLGPRALMLSALVAGAYVMVVRQELLAQKQSWLEQPAAAISLTGMDASVVVPFMFTFWYVVISHALLRMMNNLPPMDTGIFEAVLVYHILQFAANVGVAAMTLWEVYSLSLKFVGNTAPNYGAQNHRLGTLAILHYQLRILDLGDTAFLLLAKRLQHDTLHINRVLRLTNIWSWHVACRLGCGGDIYFLIVVTAACSAILHLYSLLTVLKPHALPFQAFFARTPSKGSLRAARRARVKKLQTCAHLLCLCYSILSFSVGLYPRLAIVSLLIHSGICILAYSDFHYRPQLPQPDTDDSFERSVSGEQDNHSGKVVFSFDCSSWCFFYHFGVATWVQEHFAEEINNGTVAFSGSSGGAIVACALATNADMPLTLDHIITNVYRRARRNPMALPREVQYTLETFIPAEGYKLCTNYLRVLATRVTWKFPFLLGEIKTEFRSNAHLFDILQASSTIPFVFGLGKLVDGARYIDGLIWMSSLVPWRAFKGQCVCRVSVFSAFGSDIGPPISGIPPPWWMLFPPSQEALEGMFWAGYRDIAAAFGSPDGRNNNCGCQKRSRSNSTGKPRLSASYLKIIEERIETYERIARRDWMVWFGLVIVVTLALYLSWLSSLISIRPSRPFEL